MSGLRIIVSLFMVTVIIAASPGQILDFFTGGNWSPRLAMMRNPPKIQKLVANRSLSHPEFSLMHDTRVNLQFARRNPCASNKKRESDFDFKEKGKTCHCRFRKKICQ